MDNDLVGWPIRAADLAPSYRRVAEFVPISSEGDDLETAFPRFSDAGAVTLSHQGQCLRRAFQNRKASLDRHGLRVGRARVAVDATGGPNSCRDCGSCLDGCAYGSIFTLYSAGKAGLSALTECLHFEARAKGVRVLDFRPGTMNTDFHRAAGVVSRAGVGKGIDPVRAAQDLVAAVERGRTFVYTYGLLARVIVLANRLLPRRLVLSRLCRRATQAGYLPP